MTDLQTLSDSELVDSLRNLEARHRQTMTAIVAHLIEMEQRRLHLRLGYSSLFDYCQRALGLSEDESYRRMTAARLAGKWPAIGDGLSDGSLHLSGVVSLKRHLTADNCEELLAMARHASRRELERRLAARFPEADAEEFVRARRGVTRPLSAERFALQVTISESAHEKLQRALELMSHENSERSLAPVIERALELLVEKLERARRGKKLRTTRAGAESGAEANAKDGAEVAANGAAQKKSTRTGAGNRAEPGDEEAQGGGRNRRVRRAIPRGVQRQVFERDGAECSFIGENGERCACRASLELDHVTPWALGGASSAANLRVLCRAHNRWAAEEWFGR